MSDEGHAASVTLDQIANLVAKSLVALDGSAPAGRWRLLETIRAYALEKLAGSGDAEQVVQGLLVLFFGAPVDEVAGVEGDAKEIGGDEAGIGPCGCR